MKKDIKEKAIKQALSTLKIDRIYLDPDYIEKYKEEINNDKQLVLKRRKNNGKKK